MFIVTEYAALTKVLKLMPKLVNPGVAYSVTHCIYHGECRMQRIGLRLS